jgi:hypothetical protein
MMGTGVFFPTGLPESYFSFAEAAVHDKPGAGAAADAATVAYDAVAYPRPPVLQTTISLHT